MSKQQVDVRNTIGKKLRLNGELELLLKDSEGHVDIVGFSFDQSSPNKAGLSFMVQEGLVCYLENDYPHR